MLVGVNVLRANDINTSDLLSLQLSPQNDVLHPPAAPLQALRGFFSC